MTPSHRQPCTEPNGAGYGHYAPILRHHGSPLATGDCIRLHTQKGPVAYFKRGESGRKGASTDVGWENEKETLIKAKVPVPSNRAQRADHLAIPNRTPCTRMAESRRVAHSPNRGSHQCPSDGLFQIR